MKFKFKNKIGIILSLVVIGATVMVSNNFISKGSEKYSASEDSQSKLIVEQEDNSISLKTLLIKENGLSDNLSGNPYGFAKILNYNYQPVATKVRVDYDDEFFNKLDRYINIYDGVMLESISKDDWLEFYKDANAQGVESYLNKTTEHSLIVRISGTMFMDNTIKFVNLNNIKEYESIKGELQSLTRYDINQYFIEESTNLVLVKDSKGYRKATDKESDIVLDLDNELKTATGSKLALKYYEEDGFSEKLNPRYRLKTVEVYNRNANAIYSNENFSKETLKLIEKIKNGTIANIKYRETGNLYNYTI